MRKHVRCSSNFPLGQYPDAKVPWEDVYLCWKDKPGRTNYYAAPCLECRAELLVDLKIHEDIRNREDSDETNVLDSLRPARTTTKAERQSWYREDDADAQRILTELETQDFACDGEGGALQIYTKANGIDKREAERMMGWWLENKYHIAHPKFCWKRPKFIVSPMGFGNYDSE